MEYLEECLKHKNGIMSIASNSSESNYEQAGKFRDVPSARLFLSCYVRDVWSRLDTLKASITSVFGNVLRIDSTIKSFKNFMVKQRTLQPG